MEESVARDAAQLARTIVEKLELVGLLAVEMFLKPDGDLIVNEVAPRPHNSGHWTIEGCSTSQFEQHVRAVCGLPLGSTEILRPAAMANLLGEVWQDGEPAWSKALATEGVHLHLYGKHEPRPRRKMGHLTALGADVDEAMARVKKARADLAPGSEVKTLILGTTTVADRAAAVSSAVEFLRTGEAIALPTETVYGLAADALKANAVLKIFEAKERPRFDPLIVHLPNRGWLERLTTVPQSDEKLVATLTEKFWPGPLTIVLPRRSEVPDIVTAGLETVAVRLSAHPILAEIITAFGGPLAAPSANRFGRISPTKAEHVLAELEGRIPLIVDGGATTHGLESTIVAVRHGGIEILRHGPITMEELGKLGPVKVAAERERPEAPGQLRSHYAPRTRLVLTANLDSFQPPAGRIGCLSLREKPRRPAFAERRALSPAGDLREAAANLFRYLRELDEARLDLIVAEELPEDGLGCAIMDRLRRAAARYGEHSLRSLALVREARLDEAFEKRMRLVRLALEFRVILAGEEVRVILAARSVPRARRPVKCRRW